MNRLQPNHRVRRTGRASAFSLVEVVLAIGVASFTLLSMVALLPIGLTTAHQAAEATTEAQIVQYCRNQLELSSYASLTAGAWNNPLYFDNQGQPTISTDPEEIYKVTFHVGNIALSTNAGASTAYLPNSAQLVQVIMANRTIPGAPVTNSIIVPNAGF